MKCNNELILLLQVLENQSAKIAKKIYTSYTSQSNKGYHIFENDQYCEDPLLPSRTTKISTLSSSQVSMHLF